MVQVCKPLSKKIYYTRIFFFKKHSTRLGKTGLQLRCCRRKTVTVEEEEALIRIAKNPQLSSYRN